MSDLRFIFEPRAVAIVGASSDPTKRGYQAVRALLDAQFQGRIQPVNPKGGELLGLPVAKSIAELDPVPDLALICTPAPTTPDVIRECGRKGIRGAVVLALGFSETGEAGAALESTLGAAARESGVRVVGPNTSGILNLPIGLNLIGARGARPGSIALLVQSGNMALSMLNETAAGAHEGISICIGAGNQADLTLADYLRYLESDAHTRSIALYAEGFKDGRAFYEATRAPRTKPIVLLKGGRTEAGLAAAQSHTGALAGEYTVLRAALAQAGVISVQRTDELFPVAEALAQQPALQRGIAVLSDGGGHATLAADALSELGAPLAPLSDTTLERLRSLLGANAAIGNPVDMANAPDSAPIVFRAALQALLDDDAVGGVLVAGLFGGYGIRFAESLVEQEITAATSMAASARTARKTLVVHSLYASSNTRPLQLLRESKVPVVGSLDIGCRCVAAASEWGRYQTRPLPPAPAPRPILAEHGVLLETEARALLHDFAVPLVRATFCRSADEALAAVRACGVAVMKVVARSIVHKSDVGGVLLHVSAEQASAAFRRLTSLSPDVEGVLVSPQLPAPSAEVLVGAHRDPQFGPVITVGVGGIMAEVQRAVRVRLLPLWRDEVERLIDESPAGVLLPGGRGRPPADRARLTALVMGVAECLLACEQIAELEVNPVFVYEDDALGVDARVILH